MSSDQLNYFLYQLWITGVAYGRKFPGEAANLSEADFQRVKESISAEIRKGMR